MELNEKTKGNFADTSEDMAFNYLSLNYLIK